MPNQYFNFENEIKWEPRYMIYNILIQSQNSALLRYTLMTSRQ